MSDSAIPFGEYRLLNVFQSVDAEQREKIIDFWVDNKAISNREMAARRINQVVFMVMKGEEVVGINSLYVQRSAIDKEFYFLYRNFIHPDHRVPMVSTTLLTKTYDFFNERKAPNKPKGLAFIAENPKLMKPGAVRRLERKGFHNIGKTHDGNYIFLNKFNDQ